MADDLNRELSLGEFILPANPFVWFDLDDTLWDMTGNSTLVLRQLFYDDSDVNRAYSQMGIDAWLDEYHSVNLALWTDYAAGRISRDKLRMERFALPLQAAGMSRSDAELASKRLDGDYLWRLGECSNLVSGARRAVDSLLEVHIPMGIVSNGFREVQYRKLQSGGLAGIFDPIVLSDDVEVNKPAKAFFDYACVRAGVAPEQSVIVGDNALTDIAGALDAGWSAAIWLKDDSVAVDPALLSRLQSDARCHIITSMDFLPALFSKP